jgi:hypothetical protein
MNMIETSRDRSTRFTDPKTGAQFYARDPQRSICRAAVAAARSRMDKSMTAAQHAAKEWPFDTDAQMILRAATAPLDTSNTSGLVHVALAVLPMLHPFSAAARLFEIALSVTLDQNTGTVTVPGANLVPVTFVGEGKPKPVVQGVTSGAPITPSKIAGIVPVSSELFACAGVETFMQTMLGESAGPVLDSIVFSNAAATADHPAGLLNGIAPLTPSTGGGGANKTDATMEDLVSLGAAIAPVSGASKIVLVMNVAQYISMAYRTYREAEDVIALPAAIPAGTVIAIAANAVASAMGVPEFETSTQATLVMDPATTWPSGPVSSMFQTASIAIKMILNVSWARRSNQGVAWMQNTIW